MESGKDNTVKAESAKDPVVEASKAYCDAYAGCGNFSEGALDTARANFATEIATSLGLNNPQGVHAFEVILRTFEDIATTSAVSEVPFGTREAVARTVK